MRICIPPVNDAEIDARLSPLRALATSRVALEMSRLAFLILLLALSAGSAAAQRAATVHAVLFYSPTCPHCHEVMSVTLPPLLQQYGDRLQIATINVATPAGQQLYQAAVQHLAIPEHRLGVPTLIAGSTVLVGSGEIPAQFPGIVSGGIAGEGVDWPEIPALRALLEAQGVIEPAAAAAPKAPDTATTPAPAAPRDTAPLAPAGTGATASADSQQDSAAATSPAAPALAAPLDSAAAPAAGDGGMIELSDAAEDGPFYRFGLDPAGNALAVAVLIAMLLALGAVQGAVRGHITWRPAPDALVPVLALLGLGIAAYLAWVEVTGATAVCGPVGDCNTVQQSRYARIAGMLPVGVAGMAGYALLLGAWGVAVRGPARLRPGAHVVLWSGALVGTVFSVYLTFLEPFVIGATCAWCVSSAVLITLLLLATTPAALAVRRRAPAAASS